MENEEYAHAYRKEARRMKIKKVWGGWALGTGIYAIIIALLVVL